MISSYYPIQGIVKLLSYETQRMERSQFLLLISIHLILILGCDQREPSGSAINNFGAETFLHPDSISDDLASSKNPAELLLWLHQYDTLTPINIGFVVVSCDKIDRLANEKISDTSLSEIEKNEWRSVLTTSWLVYGMLQHKVGNHEESIERLLKASQSIDFLAKPEEVSLLYGYLGKHYSEQNQKDKAGSYFELAYQNATELRTRTYWMIRTAEEFGKLGLYGSAYHLLDSSRWYISRFDTVLDPEYINELSNILTDEKYARLVRVAMEDDIKRKYTGIDDTESLSYFHMVKASILSDIGRFEQAQVSSDSAFHGYSSLNDSIGMAKVRLGQAIFELKQGNVNKSFSRAYSGLVFMGSHRHEAGYQRCYLHNELVFIMSLAQIAQTDYQNAFKSAKYFCYRQPTIPKVHTSIRHGLINSRFYESQGNQEYAIEAASKAMVATEGHDYIHLKLELAKVLSRVYSKSEDFANAYMWEKTENTIKEDLKNRFQYSDYEIAELQRKLEVETLKKPTGVRGVHWIYQPLVLVLIILVFATILAAFVNFLFRKQAFDKIIQKFLKVVNSQTEDLPLYELSSSEKKPISAFLEERRQKPLTPAEESMVKGVIIHKGITRKIHEDNQCSKGNTSARTRILGRLYTKFNVSDVDGPGKTPELHKEISKIIETQDSPENDVES